MTSVESRCFCLLLSYVKNGVHKPTDAVMKTMIPGACHNPIWVQSLEQMHFAATWAGYSYRQANDAIMLMAKRTPEMLKGAIRKKVATGSSDGNPVRAIQIRGAGDTRDVV
jgi:hypothetical protein